MTNEVRKWERERENSAVGQNNAMIIVTLTVIQILSVWSTLFDNHWEPKWMFSHPAEGSLDMPVKGVCVSVRSFPLQIICQASALWFLMDWRVIFRIIENVSETLCVEDLSCPPLRATRTKSVIPADLCSGRFFPTWKMMIVSGL